jgi:uncharacterized protein YkwD
VRPRPFSLAIAATAAVLGIGLAVPGAASATPGHPIGASTGTGTAKTNRTGESLAGEVVALTNTQRRSHGCPALTINRTLTTVAGAHSRDMAARRFFAHVNPAGRSPFDRMRAAGYRYSSAAENIAAGYSTPRAVVIGWMNSPDHRANILNCSLTQIGVGYATGGSYGNYWTQDFATPR